MIAQYPCLASNFVKYFEWTNSWVTSSTVGVQWWSLQMELLRSWGSKQMHNSPSAFQTYAIDETQSVGPSTGVMTPGFTTLSNSALSLWCMEIGHFWEACMTGWALSCSLMVFSWVLVVLEWDQADGNCLGWPWQHSSFWQLPISYMMGAPGWQDQGCLPHTNRSLSGWVVHWGN